LEPGLLIYAHPKNKRCSLFCSHVCVDVGQWLHLHLPCYSSDTCY